jgi:hypothetical protein
MRLIKKIEINYFRSIYSAALNQVGDVNLFFGRNDSGKSNILRALNLFFNSEVDQGFQFDFDIDMSDIRKQKAAEVKGRQFVSIKITFNVPHNYQNSLGKEISVKKQWNRYGDETTTSSPSFEGGKSGRLSRFLNEIDYTYIPAIKDLEVYADLIERMYSSASENSAMVAATDTFVSAIGVQTTVLTNQLSSIFSGKTSISAPADMATLFRNLDFSHGDEGHSLFKQKGDGVKARHLPELLRYINENELRKKFFLWGFEEPENSLDLSAAADEAQRFSRFAERNDTQIFISSHSPAFYLAKSKSETQTKRYFVEKQVLDEDGEIAPVKATSNIDNIEVADEKMQTAGLLQLPFVIRKLKEDREVAERKGALAESLQEKIKNLKRPTIFLEGDHDVKFYPDFLSKIGVPTGFDVRKLGGTPSNTSSFLSAVAEAGGIGDEAKTLFIFDNDNSGRTALKNLAGKDANTTGQSLNKIGPNIFACTIPFQTPPFLEFIDECSLKPEQIKFPLELMFISEKMLKFVSEKVDKKSDWHDQIHNDYYRQSQKLTVQMSKYLPGTAGWVYARMVPENLKARFLKRAATDIHTGQEIFEGFSALIQDALEI